MKKLVALLIGIITNVYVYSQTSEEWFRKGEKAYQKEDYNTAVECYKKAANLGSIDACGILSFMYYFGTVTGKRNVEMAQLWANRTGVNKILDADIVMALISYYDGKYEETISILNYWKGDVLYDEAKLALAISYMVSGDKYARFWGKQKAEPLVKDVYNKLHDYEDRPYFYYAACAILAKIEFEKEWDVNNDKVYKYLEEFGTFGEDDFIYCPLAEYVTGLILSHIEDKDIKQMGMIRLEVASQYNYENGFKILYPFANEIKQYYNEHK